MKITWLGQAGLLFEQDGVTIMIDPYLSNSVAKVNPLNDRRVPTDERFFDITPDVMIFTHDHLDHYDPETAPRFFAKNDKKITVLCPSSVWQKARTHGNGHNYVQFNRHTQWTAYGFRFRAVKAEHSDDHAIGVVIEDLGEGKTYYVTGDTLYNPTIFADLPEKIDVIFLPVNGVGNNMNATDAARFAKATGAKQAVPLHVGLFDDLKPDIFECDHRTLPEFYKEIKL
ncbi:MAG: MBL fold metallo-hydrolase [Clostridia bacterium]|nr:MBL fold metallo-hydrolase [Clostridia bacterium]